MIDTFDQDVKRCFENEKVDADIVVIVTSITEIAVTRKGYYTV